MEEEENGSHDDSDDVDDDYNSSRNKQHECSIPICTSILQSVLFTLFSLLLKKQGKQFLLCKLTLHFTSEELRYREVR